MLRQGRVGSQDIFEEYPVHLSTYLEFFSWVCAAASWLIYTGDRAYMYSYYTPQTQSRERQPWRRCGAADRRSERHDVVALAPSRHPDLRTLEPAPGVATIEP